MGTSTLPASPARSGPPLDAAPQPLRDKVAIVTGASSGVGIGIARALSAAGARLILAGRNRRRLDSSAEEVSVDGGDCRVVEADVAHDDSAGRIVSAATDAFGAVDCVVNNAGVFAFESFGDTPLTEFDRQYATHVRAAVALSQAALPHLRPGSSIVFVGSNLAHYGMAGTSAYAASKAAVESLTRTLAVELGPRGIRVNAVSPGVVRTPMTAHITSNPETEAEVAAGIPVGRLGEVDDVAAAVAYLCSPAAGYITGTSLLIDGGTSVA